MNREKVGHYIIEKNIGKGGMGEVLLAYDPTCKRKVAVKRIKKDFRENKVIRSRFLKEAEIASQLTHPSIIPIYSINADPNNSSNIFYTMPYVKGETLKEILQTTKQQQQDGDALHPIGGSLPALMRIFLNVSQAIAYTHSKGILHRDLKPDNIIVGNYGEVLILDWGIANFINRIEEDKVEIEGDNIPTTKTEKIAGTLAFMAPERVQGEPSSVLSDIYALGGILYHILTLSPPFYRPTLANFRRHVHLEKLEDPIEKAPYREIPIELAKIVKKALHPSKEKRYQKVEDLIKDVKHYIEGMPQWIPSDELNIENKDDWLFQENILLAKHTAITRNIQAVQWVTMMVSKSSFSGNVKIEADLLIKEQGKGVGFLISIPEEKKIGEDYCIWLSLAGKSHLFRSNLLIKDIEGNLEVNQWYHIKIEKENNNLRLYLNDILILSYATYLPLTGSHVGILYKDTDFLIEKMQIYTKSYNAMINCLTVPDAFLAKKNYDDAIKEYERIAYSFPGRAEGRDALFRRGYALLEKAKNKKKKKLYWHALTAFEKLHGTLGAPLEYLGKSFVYAALGEAEEEAKCLELAIRKFPRHPLIPIIKEHIVYRMHESSLQNRKAAYHLILLGICHIPQIIENRDIRTLLEHLKENWEPLYFMPYSTAKRIDKCLLCIELAFRLAKKQTLLEIVEAFPKNVDENALSCSLFALLELGYIAKVRSLLAKHKSKIISSAQLANLNLIEIALSSHFTSLESSFDLLFKKVTELTPMEMRVLIYLIKQALITKKTILLDPIFKKLKSFSLSAKDRKLLDAYEIWKNLYDKEWQKARGILKKYPQKILKEENSPFHFLYGIWLYVVVGKDTAISHFSNILDTTYPSTSFLLSFFLTGKIDEKKGWIEEAFFWEKRELYKQLSLFYSCTEDRKKEEYFYKLAIKPAG